ncbi:hypothetical protein [Pelagibacterium montanilacus]|uniref:hypothetical protein n=1 Tax=Pelagibacterium montanilacus TaxID=2185280 RepID=UPI000F8E9DA6|nr:hypothetical protein [Pelagibacterium montanilacus]
MKPDEHAQWGQSRTILSIGALAALVGLLVGWHTQWLYGLLTMWIGAPLGVVLYMRLFARNQRRK